MYIVYVAVIPLIIPYFLNYNAHPFENWRNSSCGPYDAVLCYALCSKGKVCWAIARALQLISAGAYPGFFSIKRLGVLLPLDGMLVHWIHLPSCCWYPFTPGWREAIEVKQLAQSCKQMCQ